MATTENNGLLTYKDQDGNLYLLYPVTKAELVDGLEEALAERYTDAEKIKLAGIAEGANKFTLGDGDVSTAKLANNAVTLAKLAEDAKSKGKAVVLAFGDWSNKAQTVNVEGVTADNNVLIAAAPDSRSAWNDAEIYCSAQAAGALTFKCSTAPTANVTANVVILP